MKVLIIVVVLIVSTSASALRGGKYFKAEEFPEVIGSYQASNKSCTSTKIAPKMYITAAHCIKVLDLTKRIDGRIYFRKSTNQAQLIKSFKEKYKKRMNFKKFQTLFHAIVKFGLVVRGLTFFIMGGFFIVAAFYVDANEVGGTKKVLEFLQDAPWGGVLLIIFGVGLFCFGFYSGLQAVYREIDHNNGQPSS